MKKPNILFRFANLKKTTYIEVGVDVAPDKVKHFAGSALMAFVLFAFFGLYGAAAAILIGALKEVYDVLKPRPTGFSFADLLADALGVVAGSAVAFWVQVAPLIVKIIMAWLTIN